MTPPNTAFQTLLQCNRGLTDIQERLQALKAQALRHNTPEFADLAAALLETLAELQATLDALGVARQAEKATRQKSGPPKRP